MKKLDIKDKNVEDLTKMIAERREELRQMRFTSVGGRLVDSSKPKKLRAEVARIMTELGSRKNSA